jgi:hypothetical protein
MQCTQKEIKHKQRVYKKALSLGFHHLEAGLFAAIEDGSGDCLPEENQYFFLLALTTWIETDVPDYLVGLSRGKV